MSDQRPLTPEKQLLKLIEEPAGKATAKAAAARRKGLSLFSFAAWLSRFSFFKIKLARWFEDKSSHRLDVVKIINRFLALCMFVFALYFVVNFSISMVNIKKMPDLKFSTKEGTGPSGFKEASFSKALSFYLEKVRQRDIFRMGPRKASEEGPTKGPSSKIMEATQNLRLVGISWSNDPDAMIEDTKNNRTFFVKRGQMIGPLKVQAILKDKVILTLEGEEIELR